MSIIHKKHSIFVLWKQWFTDCEDEFLAGIVIVHEDGQYLLDHDWYSLKEYRFHFDYWLRQYQEKLIAEMESYFVGELGK